MGNVEKNQTKELLVAGWSIPARIPAPSAGSLSSHQLLQGSFFQQLIITVCWECERISSVSIAESLILNKGEKWIFRWILENWKYAWEKKHKELVSWKK